MGLRNKKRDINIDIEEDSMSNDTENQGTSDTTSKKVKPKFYNVRNMKNRPHEIIVKQKTIRWEPRGANPSFPAEYKNGLPGDIINNKNFLPQSKYFHIIEREG